VLKISSSQFLFIIEILFITVGAALFFFFQNRKLRSGQGYPKKPAEILQSEPGETSKDTTGISEWKEKFGDLQQKFERMKEVNTKLKDLISSLMPKSSRSGDMQQLLSDMELSKDEFDACIGGLKKEMNDMGEQIASYKKQVQSYKKESESQKEEITQLHRKLKGTVKKAEFDSIEADKNRLAIRVEQLENQLKERNEEFNKMEKEHMWLEKEYNRMYNNIDEEHEGSLKQNSAGGQPVEG
jgi:chromosome segregation ATPase